MISVVHLDAKQRSMASLVFAEIEFWRDVSRQMGSFADSAVDADRQERCLADAAEAALKHDAAVSELEALSGQPFDATVENAEWHLRYSEIGSCPTCFAADFSDGPDCVKCEGTRLALDTRLRAMLDGRASPETLQEVRCVEMLRRWRHNWRKEHMPKKPAAGRQWRPLFEPRQRAAGRERR